MKYYHKLVICKKIIQKWVSIYETNECDTGIPNIHRFLQVDGLSTGPPGFGASQLLLLVFYEFYMKKLYMKN